MRSSPPPVCTLFASAAASFAASHHLHGLTGAALIHGYTTAFWWAAGIFGLGLLVALVILPGHAGRRRSAAAVPEAAEITGGVEPSLASE